MTEPKKADETKETPVSTKPSAPEKGPDAPSSDKSNAVPNQAAPQQPSTKTVAPQPIEDGKEKVDPEFEAALAEPDNQFDASALEKVLDAKDEQEYPEDLKETMDKLRRLHKAIPTTTPNEHTLWGAGGTVLTLKDLRTLIKYSGLDKD